MRNTYDDHIHAKNEVQDEEATKRPIFPVEQRWISKVQRVLIYPYCNAYPACDNDNRHDGHGHKATGPPTRDLLVIEQCCYPDRAEDLHDIEHQRIERPGTNVEVEC